MKKILIVNNNMHIGGVQKALLNLLRSIHSHYDVTLLLFHPAGAYLQDIPPDVRVIAPSSHYRFLGMTKYDASAPLQKLGRTFYAAVCRVFGRKWAVRLMRLGQKKLEGYDAAISYLHNSGDKVFYGGCNEFVLNHVSAARKITFLHCDYPHCGADTPGNNQQYACFDRIAACSQGCADAFLQVNPHLVSKVSVVPNCHHFRRVIAAAAEAPVKLEEGKLHIVTVARLGREKGVERALRAIALLGQLKQKFHYHIIGDGIQRPLLQQLLRQEQLEDTVTLYGELANPYRYIAAADLLLIPSYNEAAPLVIGESACLGTPVLSTRTCSAEEMIVKTGYGWVCDNSEVGMSQRLSQLLYQPDLLRGRRALLSDAVLTDEPAARRFAQLIS